MNRSGGVAGGAVRDPIAGTSPAARRRRLRVALGGGAGLSAGVGLSVAPLATVVVLVGAAAWLTAGSLAWPLVHDAPLMHYVAARILDGAVPYRDLFDMNLPGVYLLHGLALVLLGPGDAAFRAFDLAVLAGIAGGLAAALAGYGARAAVAGGALFWVYHLAGGPWRTGQRDFLLCLPLAWTLAGLLPLLRARDAVAVPGPRGPGGSAGSRLERRLGLVGLGLGAALWVKPHAVLFVPVLVWAAWRAAGGRGTDPGGGVGGGAGGRRASRIRALASVALGLALPAVAFLGWLLAIGGLGPFLDIVTGYLLPLYSRLGRQPVVAGALGQHRGPAVLVALAACAAGGVVGLWRAGRGDARLAVLAAGLAYGALHFAIQGKGWEYHLYPLALFAVALGAAALGALAGSRRRVAAAIVGVVLVAATAILVEKARETRADPTIAALRARAQAVADLIGPLAARGETVQVLDTTAGGVHALYLARARQPTRFLYDFHFYHDAEHPYVRRLRAELLRDLRARPPGAVVVFEPGWPGGGYERLERFPELARWLAEGFTLVRTGDRFRFYAARGDR